MTVPHYKVEGLIERPADHDTPAPAIYRRKADMTADMAKPEYKQDANFRKAVAMRMAATRASW